MEKTIGETNRRRAIQIAYNEKHGITPQTILRTKEEILAQKSILDIRGKKHNAYLETDTPSIAADPIVQYATRDQIEKMIKETEDRMKAAAKEYDFMSAAQYRDEAAALKKELKSRFPGG